MVIMPAIISTIGTGSTAGLPMPGWLPTYVYGVSHHPSLFHNYSYPDTTAWYGLYMRGLILYGAPASGKHTIAKFLETSGLGYENYPKLKLGHGKVAGYRMITAEQMRQVNQHRLLVQYNERYGNWYAVEKYLIYKMLGQGKVPIFHMGVSAGISEIINFAPGQWLKVWLRCSPMEARQRLTTRGEIDVEDRMTVWEIIEKEGRQCPIGFFNLEIRTDEVDPAEAGIMVDEAWTYVRDPAEASFI